MKPRKHSKGVVTVAGGDKYNTNATLAMKTVRHFDKNIPIFWGYIGEHEMPDKWRNFINEEIGNVIFYNVDKKADGSTKEKSAGGWQAKPKTIQAAPFDYILFLDADNFLLRNPFFLFETKEFLNSGACIWRDIGYQQWNKEQLVTLGDVFKIDKLDPGQAESGQILINKQYPGTERALNRCIEYNENSDIYYKVVYGDKDTFPIAFQKEKVKFQWSTRSPDFAHNALRQYGLLDNKHMFFHLTNSKFEKDSYPDTRIKKAFVAYKDVRDTFKKIKRL